MCFHPPFQYEVTATYAASLYVLRRDCSFSTVGYFGLAYKVAMAFLFYDKEVLDINNPHRTVLTRFTKKLANPQLDYDLIAKMLLLVAMAHITTLYPEVNDSSIGNMPQHLNEYTI